MSFIPWAFNVAAVVNMMNSAMTFEMPHADERVELDARKLARRLLRRLDQRFRLRVVLLLFDFLRGLPEEKIGADRRAEHGDHDGQIGAREFEMGQDKIARDREPGDADHEHCRHISEQR